MARPRRVFEELKDVSAGDVVPYEEYRGYMLITEDSGRVVIAERGLYCNEFNNIKHAKEYIDGSN